MIINMDKKEINKMAGTRLKAERIKRGFTQKEMARKIGKSISAYQSREAGRVELSFFNIIDICHLFNCGTAFLFTPKEEL